MGIFSKLGLLFGGNKDQTTESNINNSDNLMSLRDYRVLAELLSSYLSVSKDYIGFCKEIDKIKDTYIAEIILEQITNDVLAPEVSSDNIVEIVPNIDDEKLEKELKEFENRFNIDQLIMDITPDLIAYGEYTLRLVVEDGEGVVEIIDDVYPGKVIPFYRRQDIQFYLELDNYNKPVIHQPSDFVKFFVSFKRIRLRLDKRLFSDLNIGDFELPSSVKLGSPLFTPGIIKKIKELNLLEKLIPASKIQTLSKGNVIGVYVPPQMDPKEALNYAKELERKLNALGVAIDKDLDQLSIVEILKGAGRIKVIPVTSEKGQITKLDYKSDEPTELLSSIEDIRRVILSSVGIPPELVFNTGDNTKGEILKRYSRYLRKLKYIQKAIVNGIKELIIIHLINKGITVTPSDFSVRFTNSLTSIDHLDNLEVQQATVQILSDIKRFIDDLKDDMEDYIDRENFARFLNREMTRIGMDAIIVLPGEEKDDFGEVRE